jgi:hypothetical protein
MMPIHTSTTQTHRHAADRSKRGSSHPHGRRSRRERNVGPERPIGRKQRLLARYSDLQGHPRVVIAREGAAGSVLVIDRDRATQRDCRLVAHIGGDEPAENAAIVCGHYLEQAVEDRCRCRQLTAGDWRIVPFAEGRAEDLEATVLETQPEDRMARIYRLELVAGGMLIPELRWCRRGADVQGGRERVSVRDAVASLESYEPVRALTLRALSAHEDSAEVSTTVLRAELTRVQQSPIVLNRRLREAVLDVVERDKLSLSEIAIRCGRVKRDRRGNESGETSWLGRRLGLLPEAGRSTPTPWIHSDVLALIARSGLGISPHEVEP